LQEFEKRPADLFKEDFLQYSGIVVSVWEARANVVSGRELEEVVVVGWMLQGRGFSMGSVLI